MRAAAILMYHRVATLHPDVHHLCIAPDIFRSHMATVRRHHRPTALTDLADAVSARGDCAGLVAVTLDDACLDNLTIASDILQEFEIPATFFVPTANLEHRREYWWDTLERIFYSAERIPTELRLSPADYWPTATAEERIDAHQALAERIRNLSAEEQARTMGLLCHWAGGHLPVRDSHRPMLPPELVELSRRPGHSIGAHGVHHLRLQGLDPNLTLEEMVESKKTLEHVLESEVTAFAYPYGWHDHHTVAVARAVFSTAVTVEPHAVTTQADRLALPRIDAGSLSESDLEQRLSSL